MFICLILLFFHLSPLHILYHLLHLSPLILLFPRFFPSPVPSTSSFSSYTFISSFFPFCSIYFIFLLLYFYFLVFSLLLFHLFNLSPLILLFPRFFPSPVSSTSSFSCLLFVVVFNSLYFFVLVYFSRSPS
jgi:hypothetical protein